MIVTTIIGKTSLAASKLRGGGSALPGLVVEKLNPKYLQRSLEDLPLGVVVISGTNGKTTTTKMVVSMLEAAGLTVFTNNTGSNFIRGVLSSLLDKNNISGKLKVDIAVLELDEAHAKHFIKQIKPNYSLLLNVMRDQVERFGSPEYTASLLEEIAQATKDTAVINKDDRYLKKIIPKIDDKKVQLFGIGPPISKKEKSESKNQKDNESRDNFKPCIVELKSIKKQVGKFSFLENDKRKTYSATLQLKGSYNFVNATAALALAKVILKDSATDKQLTKELETITPAFGRGETITLDGDELELILVKNPAGLQLNLDSLDPKSHAVMIAMNNEHADGRDISWLYEVDINALKKCNLNMVSGSRAYDVALRLAYDDIESTNIDTSLEAAVNEFLEQTKNMPKRIYCSYTAMLDIRRQLSKQTELSHIGVH